MKIIKIGANIRFKIRYCKYFNGHYIKKTREFISLQKSLKMKHKNLKMEGIQFKVISKNSISVIYEKNSFNFGEIIKYLSQNGIKILDIVTEDSDLEDVFVQLTNN